MLERWCEGSRARRYTRKEGRRRGWEGGKEVVAGWKGTVRSGRREESPVVWSSNGLLSSRRPPARRDPEIWSAISLPGPVLARRSSSTSPPAHRALHPAASFLAVQPHRASHPACLSAPAPAQRTAASGLPHWASPGLLVPDAASRQQWAKSDYRATRRERGDLICTLEEDLWVSRACNFRRADRPQLFKGNDSPPPRCALDVPHPGHDSHRIGSCCPMYSGL